MSYQNVIQKLTKSFVIQFGYVSQAHNKNADTLATLASKIESNKTVDLRIIRKTLCATLINFIHANPFNKQDW